MIALKTIANRAFCQRGLSSNTTGVAPRVAPTSRRVQCRPVSFQDNVQAAVASSNQQNVATAAAPSGRALRMPTIELITAAVSIQAQTQQFERFAGRSAMIGVAVAVVAELLTESSIFRHFSADTVSFLGSMFIGAVSLAAAAACASKRRMGVELLEAVVTSLTANQRSAASITGRQVDTAVDNILNKAFDLGTIYSILPEDEDLL